MRALVKAKPEQGIWMEERARPEIGPKEVLVRVHKTGICGTDVHIYKWDAWAQNTVPVPMVVGHEFAGEIVEVGSDVKDLAIGQRVSGEGHVVGMNSRASRAGKFHLDPETRGIGVNLPGAFAEYLALPAFNAVPLPDSIDDELGAILDPLGNAVHTALAFDIVGEDVLITGAGPIGIMGAAVARHVGARHVVITDVNPQRLELAGKVADVVPVNVAETELRDVMSRLGMKEGFDVGLEMSGAPAALDEMIAHTVMGGRIALLGIPAQPFPFDLGKVVFRMITLKGIYGREMFETWHKMLAMLESGLDIRGVITSRMPAADYQKAFESAAAGGEGKIVLDWQ
ncbi:L-threonine 3-dehydrogenase [Devosia pacifica]|uniref:L-threonine 3-dehydrogenase n=1 Tax=Devosia pacifica TaxID=1335967 RepID=A0A918VPA6_9HYPH|nr:L-threonine 3-dehydrogenase [Devosia pacifica]GHA13079.1 L-threonine 3-dehydrogenase [Devosia pacifica]